MGILVRNSKIFKLHQKMLHTQEWGLSVVRIMKLALDRENGPSENFGFSRPKFGILVRNSKIFKLYQKMLHIEFWCCCRFDITILSWATTPKSAIVRQMVVLCLHKETVLCNFWSFHILWMTFLVPSKILCVEHLTPPSSHCYVGLVEAPTFAAVEVLGSSPPPCIFINFLLRFGFFHTQTDFLSWVFNFIHFTLLSWSSVSTLICRCESGEFKPSSPDGEQPICPKSMLTLKDPFPPFQFAKTLDYTAA